jgi:hypothetical protein
MSSTNEERKPAGRGPRRERKNSEGNNEPTNDGQQGEEPVKKEIPPPYSFPADQDGQTLQGTVVLLIQNRGMRLNFGFISLCTGEDYKDPKYPRIYYNPSCIKEKVYLRKGYQVQFIAKNDEQGRSCAQDIELTESGRQTMQATEAALLEARQRQRRTFRGGRGGRGEHRGEGAAEGQEGEESPAHPAEGRGEGRGGRGGRRMRPRTAPSDNQEGGSERVEGGDDSRPSSGRGRGRGRGGFRGGRGRGGGRGGGRGRTEA